MASAGLTFVIVVALELMLSEVDGQKACSCYTFENGGLNRMTWPKARNSCEFNNKHLVVMETTQEWEFINKAIRNRTAVPHSEWHIGLWKNRTTALWTWINGKHLTIAKWQRDKPEQKDFYAVIVKGWPRQHSSYGLFDSIQGDIRRGWICEEETDNCQGVCMHRHPSPTSTAPQKPTSPSATEDQAHSSGSQASRPREGQKFDKNCSSYVVHAPPQQNSISWEDSMGLCKAEDRLSALVSIETQEELNFVKNKLIEINLKHEYYIGLKKYHDKKWKWVSGNGSVTDPSWVSGNGNCVKMYFQNNDTVYDDIECDRKRQGRGYICEKLNDCQDKCTGECMRHSPASTTTAPPRMTSASLTAGGQANSTDSTESTTSATDSNKDAQQREENDPKIAVVAACLGAVLFLALIGLAVVLVLRRKRRRGKDAEKPKMSCSKQSEPQYESVEPAAEAARLLGKHEVNITANSQKEQPKVESEYAVVNKANKKPKKGDLVYAQLAEFDDTNNDVKAAEKPATYEPTVYAEVVPSDVYHEASPDSSQPTYENVKNTGV